MWSNLRPVPSDAYQLKLFGGYPRNFLIKGDIAHSCDHEPGPHNIKVCLVKKDNSREIWGRLAIVGPKPGKRRLVRR